MDSNALPDFSKKCISMEVAGSDCSHDLNDPRFEYQGGRLFIIGRIPPSASESGWDENQIGAVAWELVQSYVLFDSLASFIAAAKLSQSLESSDKPDNANKSQN